MFPLLFALAAAQPGQPSPSCPDCRPPTWNRMFPSPEICPGPVIQPFYRHPRVCLIDVCPCVDDAPGGRVPARIWVKEFSCPAFVPLPRFDADGHPVPGDGLVIYEGMRLTVDPDTGAYDLTFTATTPGMPVTFRLQLTFWRCDPFGAVERYTLTLPPIRMEMPRDARPGDPVAKTFQIAHRGQSTLFMDKTRLVNREAYTFGCVPVPLSLASKKVANTFTEGPHCRVPTTIDCNWEVKRDGTARFGTPVAIEDPNR